MSQKSFGQQLREEFQKHGISIVTGKEAVTFVWTQCGIIILSIQHTDPSRWITKTQLKVSFEDYASAIDDIPAYAMSILAQAPQKTEVKTEEKIAVKTHLQKFNEAGKAIGIQSSITVSDNVAFVVFGPINMTIECPIHLKLKDQLHSCAATALESKDLGAYIRQKAQEFANAYSNAIDSDMKYVSDFSVLKGPKLFVDCEWNSQGPITLLVVILADIVVG